MMKDEHLSLSDFYNTVVPRYSSLIHSRTCDKCQNQQVPNGEAFSFWGGIVTHIISSKCYESQVCAKC